jgi:signal transduction histidine kinase
VGETAAITVYRITQEALTNTARHANARNIAIRLDRKAGPDAPATTLRLSIEDDGAGLVSTSGGGGIGLLGMRERAHAAGGTCVLTSLPGQGVRIEVQLPVAQTTDPERSP